MSQLGLPRFFVNPSHNRRVRPCSSPPDVTPGIRDSNSILACLTNRALPTCDAQFRFRFSWTVTSARVSVLRDVRAAFLRALGFVQTFVAVHLALSTVQTAISHHHQGRELHRSISSPTETPTTPSQTTHKAHNAHDPSKKAFNRTRLNYNRHMRPLHSLCHAVNRE